jgi:hypothetical protein
LEFAAVGAAEVEFVAREADGDGIAWFPLAGSVASSCGGFIFAGVDHALEIHDDGAANAAGSGFAKDFGFGLVPVFGVVALDGSALLVEFGGTAADGFLYFRRVVPKRPRHIQLASTILGSQLS